MCYFVSFILPHNCDLEKIKQEFCLHHKPLNEANNPYILGQLPDNSKIYNATSKMCDCDTIFGSLLRDDKKETRLKSEIMKLKRKKWSEAKINRWIEDQNRISERTKSSLTSTKVEDGALWKDIFEHILEEGLTNSIGIILHWYTGSISSEKFEINPIVA